MRELPIALWAVFFLIATGRGAVLEFIVPEEGRYVLVDHEFADASKGAIGQIVGLSRAGTMTSPTEPMVQGAR